MSAMAERAAEIDALIASMSADEVKVLAERLAGEVMAEMGSPPMSETVQAAKERLERLRQLLCSAAFIRDAARAVYGTEAHAETQIPFDIRDILAALTEARREVSELRDGLNGFTDDYQTSEHHHPDHVLIPKATFERVAALLQRGEQPEQTAPATAALPGWVPREPTEAMYAAARGYLKLDGDTNLWAAWTAMFDAAQPASDGEA